MSEIRWKYYKIKNRKIPFAVHVGIYYNRKNTGKLYDGKGDANEKCKEIQGFFRRFYSFSGTDVHSGFCECQSGGTEAE